MPLSNMTKEELGGLAELIASHIQAPSRDAASPWGRRIDWIIGMIAIVSFIFSAGINWSRLSANEARITAVEVKVTQMQNDVFEQKSDGRVINEKLDVIKSDISEIKGRLNGGGK